MPVRVDKEGKVFTLLTKNTCYIMEVVNGKYLYHRYYGKKTKKPALYPINSARGFSPYDPDFEEEAPGASPDTALTEFAFFGNGDFRANSLKLRNSDGTCATNFVYSGYRRMHGRKPVGDLPFAEPGNKTTTLRIDMTDEYSHCQLHLFYTVYPEENIITRFFTLENQGSEAVKIEKAMSLCLDLPEAGKYDMISLPGAHSHERFEQRKPLFIGNQSVFSRRGATSHHFNPFIALCGHKTNEVKGDVYGFNLIWSGDFLSEVEVDQHSYARVQLGLGEENFGWLLEKGESFTSPEAVMTFTAKGLGEMSRNFHDFIRSYILPTDPYQERPVVLNTWEA
ncbi:MAG: alpha-galactosidase, partial [Clostridia bacterium]|nr:alpha-galactosidase [Clostridia bacterium]